jgi:hypothetical protein
VDEATRKALKILDDLVCERPPPPYVLDEEYLHLIERAEALPSNQDGAEKSWIERVVAESLATWSSVRRVPKP